MESEKMTVAFKLAGCYQLSIPGIGKYSVIVQLSDPYAHTKVKEWIKVFHIGMDVTSEFFEENVNIRPTMANLYSIINLIRRKEITK